MPRVATFPTLYDNVLQINIGRLKELGYLKSGFRAGTLTWSRRGEEIAKIGISSYCDPDPIYLTLDYSFRGEPRNYRILFESIPSNLGNGDVWYFCCPQTGKRCRVLYSIGGYFFHREAFSGVLYESQTRSKYMRLLDQVYGSYFKLDQLYEALHQKNFKKYYRGRPTKRYIKLLSEIRRGESHSVESLERLYML